MAIDDDRVLMMVNKNSGEMTQVSGNIYIPKKLKLIHSAFVMMGGKCVDLEHEQSGALFKICNSFLHISHDTLQLHKRNEIDQFKRVRLEDFENVLNRKDKAAGRMISSLVEAGALIRPNKSYKFYVNPRFAIKGGYLDCEEFHMLSMIDPKIRNCLDDQQRKGYINWKNAKKEMGTL